jgi:YHS domain-containing protein
MAEQDPVCGMMVDPAKAAGQHEHKGALYCFCSPSCLARFKADPDKFLAPSFRPIGMSTTGLTDRTSSSPSSTTASACPWLPAYSTRCWPAALAHDRQRGHEPLVGLGHRQCAPLAQAGPKNPQNIRGFLVRSGRFELPQHFYHQNLNLARLPVPPRPRRNENLVDETAQVKVSPPPVGQLFPPALPAPPRAARKRPTSFSSVRRAT